ncbi:MAG: type II toxin-antitoxin system VapC family toxin [Planctomycetes bacterium]|jgi:hypothetical protein|nr:type II toxin-antitoxin system VapC family toxin [Planctomycetota bacterium]
MKKAGIYIETSIISYLTARLSRDLVIAACQQVTAQWWETSRGSYDVVTSALTLAESQEGDPQLAKKRLGLLQGIPVLIVVDKAKELATDRMLKGALPDKAEIDASHIAVAAVQGVNFLLTWNCRHINNPETKPLRREVCAGKGYVCPEICTPFEIMEFG